ncbi:MAG: hypothetical protein ABIH49_01465 [archaeon]
MKKKIFEKRGELTTQQIVIVIVLIASFAVILFLLFRLDLGSESDKELCRNSVFLKGNSALPVKTISLNCYTSYECITENGNCEGLTNPKIVKVKTEENIYDALAENMADCWWQFGEGKVNYVGNDFKEENYCSICSQVLFDDSLNNIPEISEGKISKDDFYDYLSKTKMPGKEITYSEYLLKTNDIEEIRKITGQHFGDISLGKQYFTIMGITNSVGGYKWVGAGAAVGGIAGTVVLLIPGVNVGAIGATLVFAVSSAVGGYVGSEIGGILVSGDGIENKFMSPTIVEANSDKFKALNCKEVLTLT